MIQLTHQPIDTSALLATVQQPVAGAAVLFLGTTRQFTQGRETLRLQYDAYVPMAERELQSLRQTALDRWSLVECAITHRLGLVPLAEASVAIAVSSPHRKDAFAAGQWLIDTLKLQVPIWKQEHWADGTTEWVHPGLDESSQPCTQPISEAHRG